MARGILSDDQEVSEDQGPIVDQAVDQVMQSIYEGETPDQIVQAVKMAPSPVDGLVDQAVLLVEVAEEITQGSVPDEAYMLFCIALMGEVVEMAEAGGVQVSGREMAQATRQFIVQVVQSLGGDTAEVEQAMQAISEDQVGAVVEEEVAA